MFEVKMGSKMCMNASCGTTSTVEWKKGWPLRSGLLADLCYRCGSAYESSLFCEQFHKDQSGWRECYLCNKRLHCGCIASKVMIELMDYGGVGCSTCASCHQLNLNKRGENPGVFSRLTMKALADRQHVNGESGMNIEGGRNEADLFSQAHRGEAQPLVMGGDKREEFMPHRGFGNTTTGYRLDAGEMHESSPSQPSLNMGLSVLPYSPSFSTEGIEGKKHIGASSQSNMVHCSASNILQKPSKPAMSTPPVGSKSAQARIGRPPVEGRGKGHLLPRYWPKYTDKEVQQISGNLNLNIVPLFEKTLSASDAGRIGRLVLPKACAEAYFPPISQSEGIPLKIQDVKGKEWTFQFRYWPNNNSRMYVLEGVTPCIQSMLLQAGDTVTFSRVEPGGKLIMGSRKSANGGDMQGCGVTNGTSTEDTSSSGVTENPPSINGSSGPSVIPKESNGMPENLSSPYGGSSSTKNENNGGRIGDDPTRVKEKKRTRTIGAKNKRLLLHSEESMELRLTWEEAQDLLRPAPSAKPTIVVVEEHEIEEFDEPPVFGKRTIVTTTPSGEQERWTSCDDCSKWRRLPINALLPFKWTCIDNVWDASRCSCSTPEESLKELENVLKAEYKKRRTGESQAAKSEQEQSGLDALASAAVLGDTIGEPEVATTTRHPRHRAGCSCIVCIQPPSGKGRHKPNCGCNVCSTVKRRFKTLMMRRKKKLLERDGPAAEDKEKKDMEQAESDKSKAEKEANSARIDLNSDPYNKEDVEAVAVEKDESRKRKIGESSGEAQDGDGLGVKELEGEAEKIGEDPRGSS
ncbi:PREDICTED: B3 domain-containing transcription repressor VAL1 [Camelina sativa]|uniref:B3 domain-containing transcription repressor VAL1 n=1 Tax=Camelina sativa TaxID=90675 RepID=A0ABM0SPK7_CAMSA|nr:PREDICTED: B3 domain-containing transcription repressor VAL1 [Camelina sativa]